MLTTTGHLSRILLPAIFLCLILLRDRLPLLARHSAHWMWGLAALALLSHVEFFARGHFHLHEFYHYYVGTKYFPEVGYSGLYEATVVADYEDDPASFDPSQRVRSLRTYDLEPRRAAIARAGAIRSRFSPERWAAFKRDIAAFRERDGILWTMGESLRDFGYNGSPPVTAILGGLARQPFLPTPAFIHLAAWLDIALVVLAGALVALWIGAETGPLFVFLWAVNPFNDHAYVGGAYLRHLHLIALLVALLAYARGRLAASGSGLAIASLLRVFPAFLVTGLLVQNLVSRDRRALLRCHAPLYAAAMATALVVAGATSLIGTPDGENAWRGFARKLSLHSQRLSPNVLGLSYLFFYSEEHNVPAIVTARAEGRPLNWVVETRRTFAAHRGLYLGALAALLVALWILLRRGRPEDGLFTGLVLVFAGLHIAHYDYSILALVPFIYPGRRDALTLLAVFFIAAAAAHLLPRAVEVLDFRFYLLSLMTGLYLASMLALSAFRGPGPLPERPSPAGR